MKDHDVPRPWFRPLPAAAIAIFVGVGLTLVLWRRQPESTPASAPALVVEKGVIALAPGAPQWEFVKLARAEAAAARWTDPVPARISIDQTRASKVGTPLSGRISRVFVELGQKVTVGDPLFSVTSSDLAELRTQREKAEIDLDAARIALDRIRAVVATRALPAKEELMAQQQYRQAEIARKLADSKLASLRVESRGENEFAVRSPRTGVVVEKNVLVDEQVAPNASSPVMVVADLSSVWVVAELFEADARDVREGTAAEVTSPSLPDLKLTGRVDVVSSVVDPSHHTVPVRVRLDNPDRVLRPNVFARVRFATAPAPKSVEVASSALVSDGANQYVYVQIKDGHFSRRAVVAGSVRENRITLLSGISPGETVVAEGAVLLDNQIDLASE
jgi:cobalt-zinc-cadmium efflux system membrane fusion protein